MSNKSLSTFSFSILLILAILLEAAGYLAFPFLSVRLRDHFGFSAQEVGTILLVSFWIRPFVSFLVGHFASNVSPAKLSGLSCILEAFCFISLAWGSSPSTAVVAMILGNIGLALWRPGLFSAVYNDTLHPNRVQRISLLNGALNSGTVVGCLAGALLAKIDIQHAFLLSGGLYILLVIPVITVMKPRKENIKEKFSIEKERLGNRLRPMPLIFLCLATLCSWATLSQFTSYLSLLSTDYYGDASFTAFGFILSALTVVIVSVLLSRLSNIEGKGTSILIGSSLLAAIGWGLAFQSGVKLWLIGFVILISVFEAVTVILISERWSSLGAVKGQSWSYTVKCLGQGLGGVLGGIFYVKSTDAKYLDLWIGNNWTLLLVFIISLLFMNLYTNNKWAKNGESIPSN